MSDLSLERIREIAEARPMAENKTDIVESLRNLSAAHGTVMEGTQGALGAVVSGLATAAAAEITRLWEGEAYLLAQIERLSREVGEANGALHASENYGLVEGWRTRAERAEAEVSRLREAAKGQLVIVNQAKEAIARAGKAEAALAEAYWNLAYRWQDTGQKTPKPFDMSFFPADIRTHMSQSDIKLFDALEAYSEASQ